MRVRTILSIVAALLIATAAAAQQPTGEIFGKATDQSGAVLPGVTVTLSAPSLLQPLTAVTSAAGTYQFPRLDVGTYSVKFELAGFGTQVREGLQLQGGFNATPAPFKVFDQWIEVLPTEQIVAVEVAYDPKTGQLVRSA